VLVIDEMCCPTEERVLRKTLDGAPGVEALSFNLMQRRLIVHHRDADRDALMKRIRRSGMTPRAVDDTETANTTPTPPASVPQPPWVRLAIAGVLALGAEIVGWTAWNAGAWLGAVMALVAIVLVGIPTWKKGMIALSQRILNINALMSVAVTGALLIGHWAEAAMVVVLFTLAEHIEARSLDRARNAIRGLMDLAPAKARVQQPNGEWQEIAAEAVTVGSVLRVRAGERIALDGDILRGQPSLDESAITGESLPRDRDIGETVFAGTINLAGEFDYRATKAANDTTLARIIHAVEQAQASRAPTQRIIDRFAAIYTPAVFALALGIAVLWPLLGLGAWTEGVYRALVLLVIACPCALVISTPVTVVSGLAAAARQGILIKGGAYLEQGHKLASVALDKTGTLTQGRPQLVRWQALTANAGHPVDVATDTTAARTRALAQALAGRSNHPVAKAVHAGLGPESSTENSAESSTAPSSFAADDAVLSNVEERAGQGMVADHEGTTLWLGNRRLADTMGVSATTLADAARQNTGGKDGDTDIGTDSSAGGGADSAGDVWLGQDDTLLATFRVRDTLKPDSIAAIAHLKRLGIRVSMLSGDGQAAASAIGREAGIDDARGDLLPEDKLARLDELSRHGITAMVGDGINDAPALARADIGIAMGAAGSDVAIETADVALMDDKLSKLPHFVTLARRTRQLLIQNIALAIGIKVVFLALALGGQATLWMAVFADLGASLLVVANGLRVLRT